MLIKLKNRAEHYEKTDSFAGLGDNGVQIQQPEVLVGEPLAGGLWRDARHRELSLHSHPDSYLI